MIILVLVFVAFNGIMWDFARDAVLGGTLVKLNQVSFILASLISDVSAVLGSGWLFRAFFRANLAVLYKKTFCICTGCQWVYDRT